MTPNRHDHAISRLEPRRAVRVLPTGRTQCRRRARSCSSRSCTASAAGQTSEPTDIRTQGNRDSPPSPPPPACHLPASSNRPRAQPRPTRASPASESGTHRLQRPSPDTPRRPRDVPSPLTSHRRSTKRSVVPHHVAMPRLARPTIRSPAVPRSSSSLRTAAHASTCRAGTPPPDPRLRTPTVHLDAPCGTTSARGDRRCEA